MMAVDNPFDQPEIVSVVAKNLEPRWGLTLVSYIPSEHSEAFSAIQDRIIQEAPSSEPIITIYGPDHLHTTHLTLRRSSAWGPVKKVDLVKPGHDLEEMFDAIHTITATLSPISVRFDRLKMAFDKLGVILFGECDGNEAQNARKELLTSLNHALPEAFFIESRHWDKEPKSFPKLHLALAYLKRPPQDYQSFARHVTQELTFDPIEVVLPDVSLVHHKYRSLRKPPEGEIRFPLGEDIGDKRSRFCKKLKLVD